MGAVAAGGLTGPRVSERAAGSHPAGPAAPLRAERFRSENLVVRELRGFSRARLVVTFDAYSHDPRLDRPGFGEQFLADHRVDAVHVVPAGNHWYQYPEMPEAARAIRDIAAGYDRVVAYGSSMGGYAAIRFGGVAGASAALALSPQFSVDPAVVPFETRWLPDTARLDFALERGWSAPFVATSYIAFDPRTPDRLHVELFAKMTEIVAIRTPNTGHPCTGYLADLGLLQRAVLALADGSLDPAWLEREARARRKQSAQFYLALALKARPLAWQAALARRALELAPHHILVLLHNVLVSAKLGDEAEAERLFAQARNLAPDSPAMRQALADTYRRAFKERDRRARRERLLFWRRGRAGPTAPPT